MTATDVSVVKQTKLSADVGRASYKKITYQFDGIGVNNHSLCVIDARAQSVFYQELLVN